jgi:hypothetical protein
VIQQRLGAGGFGIVTWLKRNLLDPFTRWRYSAMRYSWQ